MARIWFGCAESGSDDERHAGRWWTLGVVVPRVPERHGSRRLIRHAVRVADQFDVGAERRPEVVDRLAGGGTGGDRERAEPLLRTLRLHERDGLVDVADVERDVMAAPVRVPPERLVLVGRLV